MMVMRFLLFFLLLGFGVVTWGRDIPVGSDAAEAEVRRVESYFNSMVSLRSNFRQRDSAGGSSLGRLYIRRPDNLRFEYVVAPHYLLLSERGSFYFIDRELQEVNRVAVSDVPLGFLLVGDVVLRGRDHRLDRIRVEGGIMEMAFELFIGDVQRLELVFGLQGFGLVGWRLFMGDGSWVEVMLDSVEEGVRLSDDLFRWDDDWQ